MLGKLFIITLLSISSYANVCHPTAGTYVILTESDIYDISNCTSIDGSLFIHGGIEVYDLKPLSNLEKINGYLVIWNNQRLYDLNGLQNLKNITGEQLYLDQYSLYIKDNFWNSHIHNGNETRNGLCYIDTINWDNILNNVGHLDNNPQCICNQYRNGASPSNTNLCMGPSESWGIPCYPMQNNQCNGDWTRCTASNNIWCEDSPAQLCRMLCPTPNCQSNQCAMRDGICCGYHCEQKHNNYLLDNNGENCTGCHSECNGCFGAGPRLCQECINYKSGDICVPNCPIGTTIEGLNCIESFPSAPTNFSVSVLNYSSVRIYWDYPEIPSGIIRSYRIYQNNSVIFSHNCHIDSNTNDYVHTHTINNLEPYTTYSYMIQAQTLVGYGNMSRNIEIRTFESVPSQPDLPNVNVIDANSINVSWSEPNESNGIITQYEFLLTDNYNYTTTFYELSNLDNTLISNLNHNTTYYLKLRAYTSVGPSLYSDWVSFTTPLGVPLAPWNLIGYSLNSNQIYFHWNEPNETNGELIHYGYEVYLN